MIESVLALLAFLVTTAVGVALGWFWRRDNESQALLKEMVHEQREYRKAVAHYEVALRKDEEFLKRDAAERPSVTDYVGSYSAWVSTRNNDS